MTRDIGQQAVNKDDAVNYDESPLALALRRHLEEYYKAPQHLEPTLCESKMTECQQ